MTCLKYIYDARQDKRDVSHRMTRMMCVCRCEFEYGVPENHEIRWLTWKLSKKHVYSWWVMLWVTARFQRIMTCMPWNKEERNVLSQCDEHLYPWYTMTYIYVYVDHVSVSVKGQMTRLAVLKPDCSKVEKSKLSLKERLCVFTNKKTRRCMNKPG